MFYLASDHLRCSSNTISALLEVCHYTHCFFPTLSVDMSIVWSSKIFRLSLTNSRSSPTGIFAFAAKSSTLRSTGSEPSNKQDMRRSVPPSPRKSGCCKHRRRNCVSWSGRMSRICDIANSTAGLSSCYKLCEKSYLSTP